METGPTRPRNHFPTPQAHLGPQSAHSGRFGLLDRPFSAKATGNAKRPRIARKPAPALARAKFIHSPRPCQFDHLPTHQRREHGHARIGQRTDGVRVFVDAVAALLVGR